MPLSYVKCNSDHFVTLFLKKAKDIIEEIADFPRFPSKERLSLIREILVDLGSPEMSIKFVHVAGTNGKGSTCSLIESVLHESGFKVGLFTSPHIYNWKERIQIDREMIPDDALERLYPEIEKYDLGVFEAWFLLALLYFKEEEVDIVILEAGIGGRLDTTNVIPSPEVAVLTNVGLDHVNLLGGSLEEITQDKAAITKEAVLVTGINDPSLLALLPPHRQVTETGDFNMKNRALAKEAIQVLREGGWEIHESAIEKGLDLAYWPLRMEVLRERPLVIADGAHNLHGIKALKLSFGPKSLGRRILVLGISADKAFEEMAPLLSEGMDEVILSEAHYHAVPAEELADYVPGATIIPDLDEAADWIVNELQEEDELYILGSLYFAADMVQSLEERGFLKRSRFEQ